MSENPHEDLAAFLEAERRKARREALQEAAGLRFMLRMPTPETGPFTVQQMAIDDYSDAIKGLIVTEDLIEQAARDIDKSKDP